ncbi:MAG: glutathione S-transferase [Proteobacteria bacterium]|nr:MAG: glutathione S-transferase [Pseudomonadota bacterium]
MITVHHLNNSRSQRILWLLEELGLPYDIKYYQRDPKTMLAPPELRAIHPLGKSPVITDGDLVVAESGAIIEYLLEKYGKGRFQPTSLTQSWVDFKYFMHYAEGSAMPPLLLSLVFTQAPKAPMPFLIRPVIKGFAGKVKSSFVNPQLKSHFEFIEKHLEKSAWFAGEDFTAADIQMSYVVEAALARGGASDKPKMKAWLEKIHSRKAYQEALKRGGPFSIPGA